MTSYKDKEIRLNYNSDNQFLPTNWKNIFSHLGKICSLTSTQNFLSKALLCTLLMFMGVNGVWGQTDYSGTYYIASRDYNSATTANNFYLCPTEGWAFFVSPNGVQGTDNNQPFLTTYKCQNGVYDASKAVWILEKHPSEANCYYIKQKKTDENGHYRYMISNLPLTGAAAHRARVHLEPVANPNLLNDMALFEITYDNGHYDIIPH